MNLDTYFGQKASMEKKSTKRNKPQAAKGKQSGASDMEPSIVEALNNVTVSLTNIDKKISTVLEAI